MPTSNLDFFQGLAGLAPPQAWLASAYDGEAVDLSTDDYVVPNGKICRAFYVGTTAGDVKIQTAAGNDLLLKKVPQGVIMSVMFKKIYKSGTAAVDIVAFS